MSTELYAIRETANGLRMVKFDELFNILAVYQLEHRRYGLSCECFASNKSTCRHRDMATLFIEKKRVGKGWFYDYGNSRWVTPIKF